MGRNYTKKMAIITATGLSCLLLGCPKAAEEETSTAAPKTLYIASGQCYSGSGITTYNATTASRAVTKWSSTNGASQGVFTDLNIASSVSVGTVPQALIDKGDHVLMLTENAATGGDRKIWKIFKNDPGTYISYANDPTAFTATATHITRSMSEDVDGSLIFSKSLLAERVNTLGARIVKGGANPWINSTATTGSCFNGAGAQIQKVFTIAPFTGTNQGKTIYIHSGATAIANRIGAVQRTGLISGTAADCAGSSPLAGISTVAHLNANTLTGPVTFSATGPSLTDFVYIPTPAPATTTGKMLVTYSGSTATSFDNNTTFNYGIVMWDVTEATDTGAGTAITFTNPLIIWRDESIVWAPSAIAYDSADNSVYVAVGADIGAVNQTTRNYGYNIEKFTLDIATPSLTRVSTNNRPFIESNTYTKCVNSITLGE
jgi:hypothetical protein